MADNSSTRAHQAQTNSARNVLATGSNGQRPDTQQGNAVSFQASDASRNRDLNPESNWLCSHYKRLCYVKFECCDKFWPCHRCHNNQSSCGRKKLKSRDTLMVKCVHCNKVQEVITKKCFSRRSSVVLKNNSPCYLLFQLHSTQLKFDV